MDRGVDMSMKTQTTVAIYMHGGTAQSTITLEPLTLDPTDHDHSFAIDFKTKETLRELQMIVWFLVLVTSKEGCRWVSHSLHHYKFLYIFTKKTAKH